MRIEKINDNQIRCFLTREDMESRQLHLKELAYGTPRAKMLFHELMVRAWHEYGFSADNMPVMIEAVPMYDDSLILNITKVENPEELDTRFASFAPSVRTGSSEAKPRESSTLEQLLESIRQNLTDDQGGRKGAAGRRSPFSGKSRDTEKPEDTGTAAGSAPGEKASSPQDTDGRTAPTGRQLYTFRSLFDASSAALSASGYRGTSSLYRDPADGKYYLFLDPDPEAEAASFGSWLSAFSEFGTSEYITSAREQHLREHCEILCIGDAVTKLASIGKAGL